MVLLDFYPALSYFHKLSDDNSVWIVHPNKTLGRYNGRFVHDRNIGIDLELFEHVRESFSEYVGYDKGGWKDVLGTCLCR